MNEDLKTILQVVGGLAFLLSQPFFWWWFTKRMKKQHADLPDMSVEDLKSLAEQQPVLHCHKVIEELKSRNEDISFAIPVLFKLAVQRNPAAYFMGWGIMKNHFADVLPELDFTRKENKPTSQERNWMQSKLNKMRS